MIPLQQLKAVDLKRYHDEHAQGDDALASATLEQHHTIAHSSPSRAPLSKPGSEPVFGPVKNKTPRTIELSAETIPLLRRHRGHQAELKLRNGERYHDHGLVFAKQWEDLQRSRDTLGDPLQANNLGQREFRKLLKAAEVRRSSSTASGIIRLSQLFGTRVLTSQN